VGKETYCTESQKREHPYGKEGYGRKIAPLTGTERRDTE